MPAPKPPANLNVKGIPPELYERWQAAARRAHRSLSSWVTLELSRAAAEQLEHEAARDA